MFTDTLIVAPNPPTGINGSRCGRGAITLNASSTDSVMWYDAPTGGNLIYVGDSYSIPGLNVTTTFYVQSGMHCNNQQRVGVTATIIPLPNVNLGNDTVATDSIILDPGAGFVTYQWNPSGTTQSITAYTSGTYSVCVTDLNGCSNCDTINVNIVVGIEQLDGSASVNLYPNPARTNVTIEMKSASAENVSMVISNLQGQIIWSEEGRNISHKTVNVSSFASGVYLLNVKTNTGTSVYRLVIE
jgi:hypothetical protein